MSDNLPPPDHNKPPVELPTGDVLKAKLQTATAALRARIDGLVTAGNLLPEKIEDEGVAREATDFAKLCIAAFNASEAIRVVEKEPYLTGTKVVDSFFRDMKDELERLQTAILKRLTIYVRAKEDRIRKEREAEEQRMRDEAEQKRKEAEAAEQAAIDEASLELAIAKGAEAKQAEADAVKAGKLADAPASKLSQTRGDYGSVSYVKTNWIFSGLDRDRIDLETLRPYITTDALERAVNAFIRAGGRTLVGVHIHEDKKAAVR